MDLATWLTEHDLTDGAFAEKAGCNQTTVGRIRRGESMPDHALIERIVQATGGAVQAVDLFAKVHATKMGEPRERRRRRASGSASDHASAERASAA